MNHGFVRATDGTITEYDVPGAGAGPGQGTGGAAINPGGTIRGSYVDASGVSHGFVRATDGTFTTFDVSGAGTGPGQGTTAQNLNPAGDIAGYYVDAANVFHGFLRTKHGAITTFDVPGAGTSRSFAIRVEKELKYFVFSKRTQKVGTTDWAAARDRDGGWSLMRGGGC